MTLTTTRKSANVDFHAHTADVLIAHRCGGSGQTVTPGVVEDERQLLATVMIERTSGVN